jgi:hypothetical protein
MLISEACEEDTEEGFGFWVLGSGLGSVFWVLLLYSAVCSGGEVLMRGRWSFWVRFIWFTWFLFWVEGGGRASFASFFNFWFLVL